jgi:2-polyprenyl-3-methyl-5-hydroxy-6-metoxy-1,4-benzoquinol methylase
MNKGAIQVEEKRLQGVESIEDYPDFHERHRVFPAVFENRRHKKILDIAAGVGCAAARIKQNYPAELICNDITPTCLRILEEQFLSTISFDLDDEEQPFPFPDGSFDAIICLATIEHMTHVDHFMKELHRILSDDGYLYLSAPNYNGLTYLLKLLFTGKTFHDPLSKSSTHRYEFFAHVKYFTYRTLLEYVSSFGLIPDTVYLPLPDGSTHYRALSKPKALFYRTAMTLVYYLFSPRWAAEPVVCFKKDTNAVKHKPRKVVL